MKFENISNYILNEFIPMNIGLDLKTLRDEVLKNVSTPELASVNKELFFHSLCHKSFVHENQKILTSNNERLEFLGDSVLSLYVTSRIYTEFSKLSEGELSKLRSSIVNEASLAKLARVLGLNSYVLVGKGENKEKGFNKDSILSDTFEALLGAIFLDQGSAQIKVFLDDLYSKAKETGMDFFKASNINAFDAKTKLQEIVMQKYHVMPNYIFKVKEDEFDIELKIKDKTVKSITHVSKKKGMQKLAQIILEENLL